MTDPRNAARQLAGELDRALGPRLKSVLLYGSVARGEAIPGVSDVNVFVVLDHVRTEELARVGPLARRWAAAGNTAPLLLGWDEWQRATDAFAIEMADMIDAHERLAGEDPLEGLSVQRGALRLQAERELRGKLLQLREGIMLAAERSEELGRLLLAALPSFVTYMRAALRLTGEPVPQNSGHVIERACAHVGADPAALLEALEARRRKRSPRPAVDDPLVTQYYLSVLKAADFVDALPEES